MLKRVTIVSAVLVSSIFRYATPIMFADGLSAAVLSFFILNSCTVFSAVVNTYQSQNSVIDNQVYYEYRYTIEDPVSGVISEKWESRLGDYVKGRYSFLRADGLIQTVHYESDGTLGYRAIVQTTKPASSYLTQPLSTHSKIT